VCQADFVPCYGDYALCYYANCTRTPASLWAGPNVAMSKCACDKFHGLHFVMINGILDEETWRATRSTCPLGSLSCPVPGSAPVCRRIKEGSLFQGDAHSATIYHFPLARSLKPDVSIAGAPGLNATHVSTFGDVDRKTHGGGRRLPHEPPPEIHPSP
jgi:hypothetical protein